MSARSRRLAGLAGQPYTVAEHQYQQLPESLSANGVEMRAVDWLRGDIQNSIRIDKERVGCTGRRAAGPLALFAAVLDKRLVATLV